MTDQSTLRQLLDEMRAIARELTDTTTVPMYDNETGKITNHPVRPLLELLDEAAQGGTGETKFKGRSQGSPAPLDLGAMQLLEQIDDQATDMHLQALKSEFGAIERIRAITGVAGRWTNTESVAWVVAALKQWKAAISGHLTPEKRIHVAAACPACGVKMVRREVEGEWRQVAALSVEPDGEGGYVCRCLNRACGQDWPSGNLQMLAAAIEQDRVHDDVQLAASDEGTTGTLAEIVAVGCTCDHEPRRHMASHCDVLLDKVDKQTGKRLRCPCAGHVTQPGRDYGWPVWTDDNRHLYTPPPCPNPKCGARSEVEWVEITPLGVEEPEYMPGMHTCTASCALQIRHDDPIVQRELRLQLHRRHPGWRLGRATDEQKAG